MMGCVGGREFGGKDLCEPLEMGDGDVGCSGKSPVLISHDLWIEVQTTAP